MAEINSKRTARSKTFDLGNSKRRTIVRNSIIHVPDDFQRYKDGQSVTWNDVDDDFDESAEDFSIRNHWFRLKIAKQNVGYIYESKLTPDIIRIQLLEIGGQPPVVNPLVRNAADKSFGWPSVAQNANVIVRVRKGVVRLLTRLNHRNAPRTLLWKIWQTQGSEISVSTQAAGHDNFDLSTEREVMPGNLRRELEMLPSVVTPQPDEGQFSVYTVFDEWTGRVLILDPVTRVKSVSTNPNQVAFPVVIRA